MTRTPPANGWIGLLSHCRLVMLYLWQDFHVIECQLDELWSFVHTKEHNLPFAKLYDETYGDAWVWVAFAPVWRLALAFVIGKRTQESKELSWFERQLWLSLAYYHLVLPHQSLRQPLPIPEPTRGSGSLRRWQLVTPAMAAGLTDHVWTTTELLSYRVPPHFLDGLPDLERLYPPFEEAHHGS